MRQNKINKAKRESNKSWMKTTAISWALFINENASKISAWEKKLIAEY
jgi:hypothetical protein